MAPKNKTPNGKKPSQKSDDQDPDKDRDQDDDDDGDDDDGDDDEDLNRRINAIVTSRVKREIKPLLALKDQFGELKDMIGKISAPKKEDKDDEGDGDGDDGEGKKAPKEDPKMKRQMSKLERELAEEREARKKAEQAQKDEHEKARRQEMVNAFDAALTEHGVTDPKLRRAALITLEQDGFMTRDEETGKIRFKGQDKYGMETLYDPKEGVKKWVTTDGKSFIPAVDTGGSGAGGSSVGNSKLSRGEFNKLSPAQKAAIELERASTGLPPLGQD